MKPLAILFALSLPLAAQFGDARSLQHTRIKAPLSCSDGYVLTYVAANLRFECLAASAGGSPGGSTTQFQYNNAGAFAGAANLKRTSASSISLGLDAPSSGTAALTIFDFSAAAITQGLYIDVEKTGVAGGSFGGVDSNAYVDSTGSLSGTGFGVRGAFTLDHTSTAANARGVWGFLDFRNSSTATNASIFYTEGNTQAGQTNKYGMYIGPISGATTKNYAIFTEGTAPTLHEGVMTSLNVKRGAGAPESAVTGVVGDIYQRTDGSTNTSLYRKESGTGNTGWVAVAAGGASPGAPDNSIQFRVNGTTLGGSLVSFDPSVVGSNTSGTSSSEGFVTPGGTYTDTANPGAKFDVAIDGVLVTAVSTTLNGAINDSTDTIVVASSAGVADGNYNYHVLAYLDTELVCLLTVTGTTWTVDRTCDTAVSHLTGAPVHVVTDTFKWRKNTGSYTTGVHLPIQTTIPLAPLTLSDGVTVQFSSSQNHAIDADNVWTVLTGASYIKTANGQTIASFGEEGPAQQEVEFGRFALTVYGADGFGTTEVNQEASGNRQNYWHFRSSGGTHASPTTSTNGDVTMFIAAQPYLTGNGFSGGVEIRSVVQDATQQASTLQLGTVGGTAIMDGLTAAWTFPSTITATKYNTTANCSSSASPAVCTSASAGSIAIPTGVTSVALTVNTTAVTANSQIVLFSDDSLGTKLGVTCNSTLATLVGGLAVTARTAGTSFQVTYNGTIATNPLCVSYAIVN